MAEMIIYFKALHDLCNQPTSHAHDTHTNSTCTEDYRRRDTQLQRKHRNSRGSIQLGSAGGFLSQKPSTTRLYVTL